MRISIFSLVLGILLGVLEAEAQAVSSRTIPTSVRSREAVERVRNRLEPILEAKGWKWGDAVFLRVLKDESSMEVWLKRDEKFELFRSYPICYFSGGLGPKKRTGDRKTPEGFYELRAGSFNPSSSYHLSMNIGFPNRYDRHHGRTGSYLMIHGDCVSVGCLAMTDSGVEEIYALVEAAIKSGHASVPVHIFPFRLDRFTLFRYFRFNDFGFWRELREGYAYFEEHRIPPQMEVVKGRYAIVMP